MAIGTSKNVVRTDIKSNKYFQCFVDRIGRRGGGRFHSLNAGPFSSSWPGH